MEYPSGAVKKKLYVVYLKALVLSHQDIVRIARVSGDSVTRYLKTYVEGGLRRLVQRRIIVPSVHYCCTGTHSKRTTSPSASYVAEASHTIEKRTGIKLALSARRGFTDTLMELLTAINSPLFAGVLGFHALRVDNPVTGQGGTGFF